MIEVQIPYKPRPLQKQVARAMRTHRFAVLVCHRRFGKSVLGVNLLQQGALICTKERPRFAYIGPTYRQAKANVWDYIQHYARPIPGVTFNQSELRCDYPNGGQLRIYGADNPDSLRGIYLDGVVLDEFGMHPPKTFSEVVRATLSDRLGWALFMGTPNGKNQFWEIAEKAKLEPEWFFGEYKASVTHIIDEGELANAKRAMTRDEFAQEYECSFEASVKGAIFAQELEDARANQQIATIPYDPRLPVDTDWDLGVKDHTAIWFSQSLRGGEIRLIDYYEASGEGLPHYAQVLRTKPYTYGEHWAPHDIQVTEFANGKSRLEVAQSLGIAFNICPNLPVEEGIHAARMLFPRCYFDAVKTQPGIEALQNYRRDYNQRLHEFKATPVHDWASHGADAFRYLAVRHETPLKPKPRVYEPAASGSWMG